MQLASAHLGLLLAANTTAKDNGFSADNSPVFWFAITGFSLALALVSEILSYRARKANKDDRYRAWKRAVGAC